MVGNTPWDLSGTSGADDESGFAITKCPGQFYFQTAGNPSGIGQGSSGAIESGPPTSGGEDAARYR